MKNLDIKYAQRPDLYIANSTTVAQRIQRIYGKEALVINYPIDRKQFVFSDRKEDFYFVSCRLLGYKRVDVVVEAFNWLGWPLLIAGEGPERKRLEAKALPNIKFLGYVSDRERSQLMARARGVIVAALEDYGLVPIEANVSGTPVISYGRGGVLDTQIPGKTGVFFDRQTPEAVHTAILEARKISWDYAKIRDHALHNFSEEVFFNKVEKMLETVCSIKSVDLIDSTIKL